MADQGLIARQTLSHALGLDAEVPEKRYGELRPAWGHEWLGKLADDTEEAVPASAGLLDAVFGKAKVRQNHTPAWWGDATSGRPRPYRGFSVDPSIAEAKSEAIRAEQEAKAAGEAAAAAAAEEKRRQVEEDAMNAQQVKELNFAIAETQKRRLGFFGRPVQKCRLSKMRKESERKAHEHQAAMFAHLLSDAEQELYLRETMNKDERNKKNKAASAAAAYRAEERGARIAAEGLKPLGAQLKSAWLQAKQAEEDYRLKAEQQEAIARKAKLAEENAYEWMQQEEEKVRICKAQIKNERMVAKRCFEELASIESSEILSLIAEEEILEQFSSVWEEKLTKVAKGTPPYFMVTNQIDAYDLRLDVVAMEQRMYVNTYIKKPDKAPSYDDPDLTDAEKSIKDIFRKKPGDAQLKLAYKTHRQDVVWVYKQQAAKDGIIGLDKGAVGGELAARKKIVQTPNNKEHPEIDLPEAACDTLFEQKTGIKLRADFIDVEQSSNPFATFLRRKDKDEGDKDKLTMMTRQIFVEVWGQDPRHKVKADVQACYAKLRHRPTFRWCCQWVIDDPARKKHLLPNSYCLGPQKHEYGEIFAPKFHDKDKPGDIVDDSTGNPRRYGRIGKWIIEAGAQVSEGADLMTLRVYDPSLVHPKKNPNGRFPPSYPSPEFKDDETKKGNEKVKIEDAMSSFDGEWIDDNTDEEEEEDLEDAVLDVIHTDRTKVTQRLGDNGEVEKTRPKILVFKASSAGKLTGLLRDPGSKICSFDNVALLDPGEENWHQLISPVSEWPTQFFN